MKFPDVIYHIPSLTSDPFIGVLLVFIMLLLLDAILRDSCQTDGSRELMKAAAEHTQEVESHIHCDIINGIDEIRM